MKKLYLDLSMGASGDMLTAALAALMPDREAFVRELNEMGVPGAEIEIYDKEQHGISGLHSAVRIYGVDEGEEMLKEEHAHEHEHHHHHELEHEHEHEHEHHHEHEHEHEHHHEHSSVSSIGDIINSLHLPEKVKEDAKNVYSLIAEAEAKVHGKSVTEVHFHEVGALDAVADVAAVCLAMYRLGLSSFTASTINVGYGKIKCAHGILPVPAPATVELLSGLSVAAGDVEGELCTPTGAALVKYFAGDFGTMPAMKIEKTGVSVGTKLFDRPNILRAFLGEAKETSPREVICELRCNIDDMTGEEMGFAMDELLRLGALDVFFQPIQMKKNRPAYMLTCLCKSEDEGKMADAIFRTTLTLGIRIYRPERMTLPRRVVERDTPLGPLKFKESSYGGKTRAKPEYDELSAIARERGLSYAEARGAVTKEE